MSAASTTVSNPVVILTYSISNSVLIVSSANFPHPFSYSFGSVTFSVITPCLPTHCVVQLSMLILHIQLVLSRLYNSVASVLEDSYFIPFLVSFISLLDKSGFFFQIFPYSGCIIYTLPPSPLSFTCILWFIYYWFWSYNSASVPTVTLLSIFKYSSIISW